MFIEVTTCVTHYAGGIKHGGDKQWINFAHVERFMAGKHDPYPATGNPESNHLPCTVVYFANDQGLVKIEESVRSILDILQPKGR